MEQAESGWETFRSSYYFWDWITLGCGVIAVMGFLVLLVNILGLPGRIAIARKHPDAEAVYALGWVGFLAIVPWIQAFIWAFKPTDKVDIRRFPKEEREAEKMELARLRAFAYGDKAVADKPDAPVVSESKPAVSETKPDQGE